MIPGIKERHFCAARPNTNHLCGFQIFHIQPFGENDLVLTVCLTGWRFGHFPKATNITAPFKYPQLTLGFEAVGS